jgi:vitamin B12 transporter
MRLKYLILLSSALIAQPLCAQDEDNSEELETVTVADALRDSSITVLASGGRERLDWTGESISVFDREAMNSVQGADLSRVLERAPGVSLSRNGGLGNFTAVRVRGADGEQLLVLIDGVRVADPAAPGGGFDFGNLLMGNLSKVELQRGSNSTIWGSQALGGVLAATTGNGATYWGSAEYGAHDTLYAAAGGRLDIGPAVM